MALESIFSRHLKCWSVCCVLSVGAALDRTSVAAFWVYIYSILIKIRPVFIIQRRSTHKSTPLKIGARHNGGKVVTRLTIMIWVCFHVHC